MTLGYQWEALVAEFDIARQNERAAMQAVTARFVAIGAGTSRTNPTADEMDEWDRARAHVDDVQKRMDAFVKKHT